MAKKFIMEEDILLCDKKVFGDNEEHSFNCKCYDGYAECTTVIDINQLDGSIMEIPYGEYKEWWDNNYHCLGVAGL